MKPTVLVLGSGPIRIGQGIEFDYSCVHCVWSLQRLGYRAILINNNPETVSTDFDTADALYFEPVTLDDVMGVVRHEQPVGVVCQFGGQTAIDLALGLASCGVKVLGTSPDAIAAAEDRGRFDGLLERLGIARPAGKAVRSVEEAASVGYQVGYPVLVRPSYVLGGRAMEIVHGPEQLVQFFGEAEEANPGQPVLVDKYLLGTEAEVDVVCDGTSSLVPGVMEHIERAGVHSGDSMAVYPPTTLSIRVQTRLVQIASSIARALDVRGLMNIQFVIADGPEGPATPYVLEVNPRASRTVPFLSKVTGVPMVDLATRCMMGETLGDNGYGSGLWTLSERRTISERELMSMDAPPACPLVAVKAPVFSFQKLTRVEPSLGPEMKSTGEVMGIDFTYESALYKALIASGVTFRPGGHVVLTVNDADKPAAVLVARELAARGFPLSATPGTHSALEASGISADRVNKIKDGSPNLLELILKGEVSLMVNTPSLGQDASSDASLIRRSCIERGIACVTNIETAMALARASAVFRDSSLVTCQPYDAYLLGK